MKLMSRLTLIGGVALLVVSLAAPPATAQQPQWFSISAKFVCGAQQASQPPTLAIGRYKTIVNIHNPHYLQDEAGAPLPLVFYKKVVLSQRQGDPILPPSCKLREELPSDTALQVDCGNIKAQLALSGLPATGPVEGFVVFEIPSQGDNFKIAFPDVVAVYTSGEPQGEARSLDVETVQRLQSISGTPTEDPCVPD